jgi:hypothetical protein
MRQPQLVIQEKLRFLNATAHLFSKFTPLPLSLHVLINACNSGYGAKSLGFVLRWLGVVTRNFGVVSASFDWSFARCSPSARIAVFTVSTAMAKFRFWLSLVVEVAIPITCPDSSRTGEPLEPGAIAAVI